VRRQGGHLTAEAMREDILDFASRHTGVARDQCRLDNDAVILRQSAHQPGRPARRRSQGGPPVHGPPQGLSVARSVAFNVHGVRLAVHRITGEVRILHSVHAADIGRPINPMQCRGQLEWRHRHGLWLGADREHGPSRRPDGEPAAAQLPHPGLRRRPAQRALLRRHARHDRAAGRQGHRVGECAINPVAPAVSNALANATGVRFADLPFTPDRLFTGSARRTGGQAVTVSIVTQTCVRPESAQEFARWQGETSTVIAGFRASSSSD